MHEDLHGNTIPGSYAAGTGTAIANWSTLDGKGRAIAHGTHVAGTVCAEQNGIGLVGVMWDCTINALDFAQYPWDARLVGSKMAAWLSVRPQVKIVNMSFGFGAHYTNECRDRPRISEGHAMAKLFTAFPKVLFVVAAGNCGSDANGHLDTSTQTPANLGSVFGNVVTVASHNRDGGLSAFSNTGAEVAAPGGYYSGESGSSVWSTTHDCHPTGCSSFVSTYEDMPGTSMAAPFISGIAGLMLSHRPGLTAVQLAACITGAGSPYSVPGDPGLTAIAADSALDCAEAAANAAIERDALIDIYWATGGPNWTARDRWLTRSITANGTASGARPKVLYEGLGLWRNGLSGRIPDSIGDLKNLGGLACSRMI